MKLKIVQPHADYPLAYVYIRVSSDMRFGERRAYELENVLGKHDIAIIGRWEVHDDVNGTHNLRAPVLLEDEYTKHLGE